MDVFAREREDGQTLTYFLKYRAPRSQSSSPGHFALYTVTVRGKSRLWRGSAARCFTRSTYS